MSQRWSPYLDDVSHATFGSLPWRSRSQHDLAAKSYPVHICYLKSDFTTILQKWSPYWDNVSHATFGLFLHFELFLWHNSDTTRGIPSCVQNLFGEHHPVQPALVLYQKCNLNESLQEWLIMIAQVLAYISWVFPVEWFFAQLWPFNF
jgi:hypothetical protein